MFTKDSWITYAHKKGGYAFRPVYDTESDPFHFDGYLAGEGNKEQIDSENVPFITTTGNLGPMILQSLAPAMLYVPTPTMNY
jgi:hypothetical protein